MPLFNTRRVRNHCSMLFAILILCVATPCAIAQNISTGDLDALPEVPEGFRIEFAAREPLVRNPCSIVFDDRGRLCVGLGPQYRSPAPETPGDSVVILTDHDGDGRFDDRHTFATGFNCIQGLEWNGRDLWVANAPDLTIVRDRDGDDVADEYVRLYTDLGNLEHGIHGLNRGPDGRMYFSKGNSKGLSRDGRFAPKPFRDLWGVTIPDGVPDFPAPQAFTPDSYQRAYHDPADDWGREGGVLVCDADGSHLEIISRGFRNPWDIAFDDNFDWAGTDNDQNLGDRVFVPFFGSHYGWSHAWSAHWSGHNHPPTAPVTGPLFEGSGTGIAFCDSPAFPDSHRGVWLFNDWLRRSTYLFRPAWNGAQLEPAGGEWTEFVRGGSALFKPTDLAIGPDGSLYIAGWGREYGVQWDDQHQQINEGRIFRVTWTGSKPSDSNGRASAGSVDARRDRSTQTIKELVTDFDSPLIIWRTAAQDELVRRATAEIDAMPRDAQAASAATVRELISLQPAGGSEGVRQMNIDLPERSRVRQNAGDAATTRVLVNAATVKTHLPNAELSDVPRMRQTWLAWTLGRIAPGDTSIDAVFQEQLRSLPMQADQPLDDVTLSRSMQAIRILSHRIRMRSRQSVVSAGNEIDLLASLLRHPHVRIRFAAVQAIHQAGLGDCSSALIELAGRETDRVTSYAVWQALRSLLPEARRRDLLNDSNPRVRQAAFLSLAEDRQLATADVQPLLDDADSSLRDLAALWLSRASGHPLLVVDPPGGEFRRQVSIDITPGLKPATIRFTVDGTTPQLSSPTWRGGLRLEDTTTLKAILVVNDQQIGSVAEYHFERLTEDEAAARSGVLSVRAASGHRYRVVDRGLESGRPAYTDRGYWFEDIPAELSGSLIIQTANQDAGSRGDSFLQIETAVPLTVLLGYDTRIGHLPEWLTVSDGGQVSAPASTGSAPQADSFRRTDHTVRTTDATFRLFERAYPAGRITLGGNTNDGSEAGRSQYLVILRPTGLTPLAQSTTVDDVVPLLERAQPERGRSLFFATGGAGCTKCHHAAAGPTADNPQSTARPARASAALATGTGFGPDLRHLVDSRDARHIITSILEPSARIKEGYALRTALLKSGRSINGLLREETASTITLMQADGTLSVIDRDDIEEQFSQRVSPMPSFDRLLTAAQVADITAWLLRQSGPSGNEPQSQPKADGQVAAAQHGFSFVTADGHVDIRLDDAPLMTWVYRDRNIPRPYFAHVKVPGGIQVTRNHPPQPDDPQDHAEFHPGLFMAFGDLSGHDSWRLKAPVVFDRFVEQPAGGSDRASFQIRQRYLTTDRQSTVCQETATYTFIRHTSGVVLDWSSEFSSEDADFHFGDQEEMGLGARVASPLRESGGSGRILNSAGATTAAATWGQPAEWCDYAGTINGRHVGITIIATADNPRPSWWHNRDYGVFVANLFGREAMKQGPRSRITVPRGETFRLHYAVLLHSTSTDDAASFDPAAAVQEALRLIDE